MSSLVSGFASGLSGLGKDRGGGPEALPGEVQRSPAGELEDQSELAGPQRVQGQQAIAAREPPSRAPGTRHPRPSFGAEKPEWNPTGENLYTAFCLHWLFIYDLKCFRS